MKYVLSYILVLTMLCMSALSLAETDERLAEAASVLIEVGEYDKAKVILDYISEGKYAMAYYQVGYNYYYGYFNGGMPDYANAESFLLTAAGLGQDDARRLLGLLYFQGLHNEAGVPDYTQAYQWLLAASESGDMTTKAKAQAQLGIGFYRGYFTEDSQPDYQRAHEYLTKADAQNYIFGTYWLGKLYYESGLTGEPDYKAAYDCYLRAAESNYQDAMHELADGYLDGSFNDGVIDVDKALEWYIKADENGSTCAYNHVLDIYMDGVKDAEGNVIYEPNREAEIAYLAQLWERGTTDINVINCYMYRVYYTEKDYDLAIVVGEKGAELGSGYCMLHLGSIYRDKNDPDASLAWYTKCAETSYTYAMIDIGDGYKNGFYNSGVPDGEKAVEWYKKADEAGREEAPARLAQLYCSGIKGEDDTMLFAKDFATALPYLERVMEAGTDDVYYYEYLGWIYGGNTDACEANYERALEVHTAGEELGSGYCMWQIGLMHLNGELVDSNVKMAVDWLTRAVENGMERAQKHLDAAKDMLDAQ